MIAFGRAMNYCALDDAFQVIGDAPPPGCANDSAAKAARREERRKARKCKTYACDPDRLVSKLPDVPKMEKELPFNIPAPNEPQKPCPGRKSYFGKDPDDGFADYIPDAEDYRLKPDFLQAFEEAGVARAGSTATLPNPSINMYWKPLTKSGARTSFEKEDISNDAIMRKLDRLWARLDDMNTSSPEQVTSELLMFISSGIFVIFMMDILVRKGSTIRF